MSKELKDILYKVRIKEVVHSTELRIDSIQFDSRLVDSKSLFIAVRGTQTDGHKYIDKAIENGASAIVCEEFPEKLLSGITYIKVENSAVALGLIASNFYDNPSSKLKLVGVTGTNGKTTIVTLFYKLFRELGYSVGMLSTIHNLVDDKEVKATHTTPDAIQINKLLHDMVDKGCEFCFMEVSSHAVAQKRIEGLDFDGGVFTNITHDHLDYHPDFDDYLKAKKAFFDNLPANAFALSNMDDKNGRVMLQNTKAVKRTYSLKSLANHKCRILENQFDGMLLKINGEEVWFKLVGEFNAYNILAVFAAASQFDLNKHEILATLSKIEGAEGRFDILRSEDNITAIVDYAHTPDALKNVLKTINSIRTKSEQLITVCGAGGDRDPSKRPEMGKVATDLSDKVIFTSDNPRTEDPDQIIEDIRKGVEGQNFKKALAITNRKEAIRTACSMSKPGDIILVAGKGHEKYQDINGVKHHFDDKEVIREFLNI
jgi:UDP-N-acetylmuramoyl-L-alanyl-D-glutamate--2,6-diaminopimelate ligase